MEPTSLVFWLAVVQIVLIDVLLSGDNAVVIALACRSLPPKQRTLGITLGVAVAFILRIVFAALIAYFLAIPYLKLVGGVALLYIAIKLVKGGDDEGEEKDPAASLLKAVGMIAVADVTMSLDNVVAVAAASHGQNIIFILGLLLSMPLMIFGASLLTKLINRFPVLVLLGGALLGWIAGQMAMSDPSPAFQVAVDATGYREVLELYVVPGVCAALTVAAGLLLRPGAAATPATVD